MHACRSTLEDPTKKNGVEPSALRKGPAPGKKGDYALCDRRLTGQRTKDVLPNVLAEMLAKMSWPKSMRWGHGQQAFARPIHWIVAMLGKQVLPVSFAGITAGDKSRGHRFLAPQEFKLDGSVDGYVKALRKAHVIVDPAERLTAIEAEIKRVEKENQVTVRSDRALLEEVVNLVEYPVAVCGNFDAAFLKVPEPVIVSAMRGHQRYFATEVRGKLAPKFVTIAGTVTRDSDVVRAGNERVLAARLTDAKFFFEEDQKVGLEAFTKKLSGVVFQAKLGTVAQKLERIRSIGKKLAELTKTDVKAVDRAAALCKSDLTSHMVGEFPDLQGVMGHFYAAKEAPEVAQAIEEHYWPKSAGAKPPSTDIGAIVSLADRIDTVVGCFAAGLQPTGSADPYALRRHTLAVLTILIDRKWSALALGTLFTFAKDALAGTVEVNDKTRDDILEFFKVRMRGLLEGMQLPVDCVDAALAADFKDVPDAVERARAVSALRKRDDFEPLATTFKRVANILKDGAPPESSPSEGKFVEEAEKNLWKSFSSIEAKVEEQIAKKDYAGALSGLASLKPSVDSFFDKVMVMDKDEQLKKNRLLMLGRINSTFRRIADFRQLSVQG